MDKKIVLVLYVCALIIVNTTVQHYVINLSESQFNSKLTYQSN